MDVCVSVAVAGHLAEWKTIAGPSVSWYVLLMMSNICLSYLSGLGMRLTVLAPTVTTLLPPRSVSPVAVSLPSQMASKKRCSILEVV